MAELAPGKRVISKDKSEQRVNLKTLLGREPTEKEKDSFIAEAIEHINQRTLSGKDLEGSKFQRYSKEYAEKKGVTRDSVDLFLKGDMLDSIEPVEKTKNTVTFGILGSTEALKSYNHNTGDTLPKREFFGITRKEAEAIIKRVEDKEESAEVEEERGFTLAELKAALESLGLTQEE